MKQLLFERGDINSRSFFDGENFHELTEIIGGLDRFDLRLPIVNLPMELFHENWFNSMIAGQFDERLASSDVFSFPRRKEDAFRLFSTSSIGEIDRFLNFFLFL